MEKVCTSITLNKACRKQEELGELRGAGRGWAIGEWGAGRVSGEGRGRR